MKCCIYVSVHTHNHNVRLRKNGTSTLSVYYNWEINGNILMKMSFNVRVFFTIFKVSSPKLGADSEVRDWDCKALLNLLALTRPTPWQISESKECRPFSLTEFGDLSNVCREARRLTQDEEGDRGWEKEVCGVHILNEWIDLTIGIMMSFKASWWLQTDVPRRWKD